MALTAIADTRLQVTRVSAKRVGEEKRRSHVTRELIKRLLAPLDRLELLFR
jgi:hypothetical protein